jgi:hypothetical protein
MLDGQTRVGCKKKAPDYAGALNVFVLNLTVTKLVIQ